jgi:hypothetical protein
LPSIVKIKKLIDMFNGVIAEGPSNGTNPDYLEFLAKEKANLILKNECKFNF